MEFFENGYKYVVDIDHEGARLFFNDECIDNDLKKECEAKIDRYSADFFYVEKQEQCGHCSQWHFVDSLNAIFAESERDALNQFLLDHAVCEVEA